MIGRPVALLSIVFVAGASIGAGAQTAPTLNTTARPRSFEIGTALVWLGGFDLGSATAQLPRNPSTGTEPFTLFQSSGRQDAAPALGATIGFSVTRIIAVEAFGSVSKPVIRIAITQDAERSSPAEVADTGITEYALGGSLLVNLPRITIHRRLVPFLLAGAGFVWQVAADTSVETGHLIHVGGGAKYLLFSRRARRVSAVGLRGDLRLIARDGGVGLDQRRRVSAAAGGGVFVVF